MNEPEEHFSSKRPPDIKTTDKALPRKTRNLSDDSLSDDLKEIIKDDTQAIEDDTESINTKNMTFFQMIQARFDLPKDISESEACDLLYHKLKSNNKNREKILKLKTTIHQLQNELSSILSQKGGKKIKGDQIPETMDYLASSNAILQKNEEKLTNKISSLQNKLHTIKMQKQEIEDQKENLKYQFESVKNENEELQNRIKLLQTTQIPPKPEEDSQVTQKLMTMISELSVQYQTQADELSDGAKHRNELVKVIQQQEQLIHSLELKTEEAKHEQDNAQVLNTKQISEDNIFRNLVDIVTESSSPVIDTVVQIAQSAIMVPEEKVSRIMHAFVDRIKELELKSQEVVIKQPEEDSTNKILITAMHNQLHFLEKLINSDENRHWMFDDTSDDAKQSLMEQAARLQSFLTEHTIGLIEDWSMFDLIDLNADPLTISNNIKAFLEQFADIRTKEGKLLLAILRQAIVAANVLRRFAFEARNQCALQVKEIKILHRELHSAQSEYASQLDNQVTMLHDQLDEEIEKREQAEDTIQNITNYLKSAAEKSATPEILDCIDQFQYQYDAIDEDTYKESLEKQLSLALSDLTDTKAELSEIKEAASKEVTEIFAESQGIKTDAESMIQSQTIELKQSKSRIDDLEKELENLETSLVQSQEKYQEATQEIEKTKQMHEEQMQNMVEELEQLKDKMNYKLEKRTQLLLETEKERRQKLTLKIKQLRNELEDKDEEISDRERKIVNLQKIIENSQREQKRKSQSSVETESALQNTITILKGQVRELSTKLLSLEMDNKLLNSKIKAQESKAERDLAALESRYSIKKFSQESEIQMKIDNFKSEVEQQKQKFLMQICQEFKDFVDFSKPLNEQYIFQMLQSVKSHIRSKSIIQESPNKIMKELQQILQAQSIHDIPQIVNQLLDDLQDAKEAVERTKKEMKQEDSGNWENWARRLYISVTDGSPGILTIPALKLVLEEAIYVSAGHREIQRRIESLREQKKFLLSGYMNIRSGNINRISPIIIAVSSIFRMQKFSGHMPSDLSFMRVETAPFSVDNDYSDTDDSY